VRKIEREEQIEGEKEGERETERERVRFGCEAALFFIIQWAMK
jgi:hypothetical protein